MTYAGKELPDVPGAEAPQEPLLSVAGIVALVGAALAFVVAFGLHLNEGQTSAILGLATVLAPIVVWVIGRMRVFSPRTVHRLVTVAKLEGRTPDAPDI